jgi:hypothetical protein
VSGAALLLLLPLLLSAIYSVLFGHVLPARTWPRERIVKREQKLI